MIFILLAQCQTDNLDYTHWIVHILFCLNVLNLEMMHLSYFALNEAISNITKIILLSSLLLVHLDLFIYCFIDTFQVPVTQTRMIRRTTCLLIATLQCCHALHTVMSNVNDWGNGRFEGHVTFPVHGEDIGGWECIITFSEPVTGLSV